MSDENELAIDPDLQPAAEKAPEAPEPDAIEQQPDEEPPVAQVAPAAEQAPPAVIETVAEVAVPAPPVTPEKAAAIDRLKLHLQEIKLFVRDFDHDAGDDLNEIVAFLKAKL